MRWGHVFLLQNLSDGSIFSHHFNSADADDNGYLDSLEWLRYIRSHKNKEVDEELEDRRYFIHYLTLYKHILNLT